MNTDDRRARINLIRWYGFLMVVLGTAFGVLIGYGIWGAQ